MSPNGGEGEELRSQPMSTDVRRSPNKLRRSTCNSIFNLCLTPSEILEEAHSFFDVVLFGSHPLVTSADTASMAYPFPLSYSSSLCKVGLPYALIYALALGGNGMDPNSTTEKACYFSLLFYFPQSLSKHLSLCYGNHHSEIVVYHCCSVHQPPPSPENAEAKSKVPDWGLESTLAYMVAHGKCVGVDSGLDIRWGRL